MAARTARPPIVPPTMAEMGVGFSGEGGVVVGVEVVDEVVEVVDGGRVDVLVVEGVVILGGVVVDIMARERKMERVLAEAMHPCSVYTVDEP